MRKAFTLIEVLVVVSIIALLIAILLPVLSQTRYTANLTKCQAVLKGIGDVNLSYAVDNDGFLITDGYRFGTNGETGSWFAAAITYKAQERSWWLRGRNSAGSDWDVLSIYEDYMQREDDIDSVLNCPIAAPYFINNDKNEQIISYMLYTTNNYRTKHFYYADVGGYEQVGTWSPNDHKSVDFNMLASDFAVPRENGKSDPSLTTNDVTGAMTAHPASNGYLGTYASGANDFGGYIVGPSQDAPLNFVDGDGSVQQFKVNGDTYLDTDNWLINSGAAKKMLLPKDLAK